MLQYTMLNAVVTAAYLKTCTQMFDFQAPLKKPNSVEVWKLSYNINAIIQKVPHWHLVFF